MRALPTLCVPTNDSSSRRHGREKQRRRLAFIAVAGLMDCRETPRDGRPGVELSWEGGDEGDPASGRGRAALQEDGSLRGRIYFHLGNDSSFHALRADEQSKYEAKSAAAPLGAAMTMRARVQPD